MNNHTTPLNGRNSCTLKNTQLQFTWRFLAVPTGALDTKPIVLLTNASSEQEARANCVGWKIIFTARLPLHHFDIRHTGRLPAQEVRHG